MFNKCISTEILVCELQYYSNMALVDKNNEWGVLVFIDSFISLGKRYVYSPRVVSYLRDTTLQ